MKNNKINESALVKKIMKEILPILEQSINEYNSTEWNDIADRFDSMYNTRAGAFARQRGVEARERELHTEYTETMEELSNLNLNKRQCSILKNEIKKIHDEIVNGRRQTLPKEGEFSSANIVFKVLRRSGHLQKIKEIKTKLFDKINSL